MTDFPALQNDLLLRAARQQPTERTPVWMMRQAGRYLPEYRALREKHAFFEVVRTPELASEVTLQPVERFAVDAAIIFCDILVVPQVMGLEVKMVKGKGPHFPEPLHGPEDLARLREVEVKEAMDYVYEAIALTRRQLRGRVPLIGFCGAPWTLMAYMIEGGGSKRFARSKAWLYRHPEASHQLLRRITDVLVDHLVAQIDAGAQVVQVFDSWAGLLGPREYSSFAFPYLREIADRVGAARPDVPKIAFAKGAHYALPSLAETGYEVISLDWTMDPRAARRTASGQAALQGNLDPCVLYADPVAIREEVRRMLAAFGTTGHVANLGHGMHPDHQPEHARAFIEAVHELSSEMRAEAVT